jgi:hypothetical protein
MICPKCKQDKPKNQFYSRPDRKGKQQSYCKSCNLANTLERQQSFKKECVNYKGGKCKFCGYNRCIGALEFHHRDPNQKDFTIAHLRLTSWKKNESKIKLELDKCDLLCSNCHREQHSN